MATIRWFWVAALGVGSLAVMARTGAGGDGVAETLKPRWGVEMLRQMPLSEILQIADAVREENKAVVRALGEQLKREELGVQAKAGILSVARGVVEDEGIMDWCLKNIQLQAVPAGGSSLDGEQFPAGRYLAAKSRILGVLANHLESARPRAELDGVGTLMVDTLGRERAAHLVRALTSGEAGDRGGNAQILLERIESTR